MVTDGSYTCGEHRIKYRLVKSLSCTPETNDVILSTIFQLKKNRSFPMRSISK